VNALLFDYCIIWWKYWIDSPKPSGDSPKKKKARITSQSTQDGGNVGSVREHAMMLRSKELEKGFFNVVICSVRGGTYDVFCQTDGCKFNHRLVLSTSTNFSIAIICWWLTPIFRFRKNSWHEISHRILTGSHSETCDVLAEARLAFGPDAIAIHPDALKCPHPTCSKILIPQKVKRGANQGRMYWSCDCKPYGDSQRVFGWVDIGKEQLLSRHARNNK
jgi:hypothetical protein